MNQQKCVGIFNPEWQLVMTLSLDDGRLVTTDLLPNEYGQATSIVLERLKREDPKLNLPIKDEAGCVIDMVRARPDDERYLDGVVNELKQAGLQAYSLNVVLLDLLKKVNNKSVSLRTQVLPEVITLHADQAIIALEAII